MKLFEYWTELPQTLAEIYSELLPSELVQFSKIIYSTSKKVLTVQEEIVKQFNGLNLNEIKKEEKMILQDKFAKIEKEKSLLAIQGVKTTTKLFSEILKYFEEKVSFPSKENLTQLKLTLNFTRLITSKLNEEYSFSTSQSTQANIAYFNKDNQNSNTNEASCLSSCCDEEKQKLEFIKVFNCFIEKVQSKLFTKSNELVKLAIKGQKDDSEEDEKKESRKRLGLISQRRKQIRKSTFNANANSKKISLEIKQKTLSSIDLQEDDKKFSRGKHTKLSIASYCSMSTNNSENETSSPKLILNNRKCCLEEKEISSFDLIEN